MKKKEKNKNKERKMEKQQQPSKETKPQNESGKESSTEGLSERVRDKSSRVRYFLINLFNARKYVWVGLPTCRANLFNLWAMETKPT